MKHTFYNIYVPTYAETGIFYLFSPCIFMNEKQIIWLNM